MEKMRKILNDEKTIMVFDTNIYLNLYRYSPDVRMDYFNIYKNEKIIRKLYLTETILYEIEKNMKAIMESKHDTLENRIKDINKIDIEKLISKKFNEMKRLNFPNIEDLKRDLIAKGEELSEVFEEYLINHGEILSDLEQDLQEIDMVKEMKEILQENNKVIKGFKIIDLYKITEEGEKRYKDRQAPGYDDSKNKKGLSKFNDFIIWKEVIKFCKENNKNLIYVTEDKKEWNNNNEFPTNMIEEFKNNTSNEILGMDISEFIDKFCLIENITKPNGLTFILNKKQEEEIENILDDIKWEIEKEIESMGEDCANKETLTNYDGSYFEIEEIESIELMDSKIEIEKNTADYILEFEIEIKANSKSYYGKDDDGTPYLANRHTHFLKGNVEVHIKREIELYAEIENGIELEDIKIYIEPLEEYKSYTEDDLCVICGTNPGEYYYDDEGLVCSECISDLEECPTCGKYYDNEKMAGDGFCLGCSRNS